MIFCVQIAEIPKKLIMKIGEFWNRIAKNQRSFENKIAAMRKCWTEFSRIFECRAVQKRVVPVYIFIISFSISVLFSQRTRVNVVDLVKSFETSIYLQKSASIQPITSHLIFLVILVNFIAPK